MNDYITIRIDDFIKLNENATKFDFLIEALKNAATLDYTGERLSFSTDMLDTAYKCALPVMYSGTLNRLQTAKQAELLKDEY